MKVRIYRPAKTAMQSGEARTHKWVLEFEPTEPRSRDPLTGWTSSADTRSQVRLSFDTLEEAIAYADRQGYTYSVQVPHRSKIRPKNYADNFRLQRI
jgi:NADH dehydrogenase ubiquinone Fe-S protein 4